MVCVQELKAQEKDGHPYLSGSRSSERDVSLCGKAGLFRRGASMPGGNRIAFALAGAGPTRTAEGRLSTGGLRAACGDFALPAVRFEFRGATACEISVHG